MAPGPFVVNVADIRRSGGSRPAHIETPVDWKLAFSALRPSEPLVADLVLRSIPGGLVVTGDVEYLVEHRCTACLEPFVDRTSIPIAVTFELEPDEDGYALVGDVVDLEQMIRDEVMLSLPLVPRCGGAHEEVVTSAGTDLNTGSPDTFGDSPFAVLREVLEADDRGPGPEGVR